MKPVSFGSHFVLNKKLSSNDVKRIRRELPPGLYVHHNYPNVREITSIDDNNDGKVRAFINNEKTEGGVEIISSQPSQEYYKAQFAAQFERTGIVCLVLTIWPVSILSA